MENKHLERFLQNTRGAVAALVVICLPLLLVVLLITVDAPRLQKAYMVNKGGLDAAATATAEFILQGKVSRMHSDPLNWTRWRPTPVEVRQYAYSVYTSNFENEQTAFTVDDTSFSATYNGEHVIVSSCLVVKNYFAAATGAGTPSRVCHRSDSIAQIEASGQLIMAAFSLDATASMRDKIGGKAKINLLEVAMKSIINKYYSDGSTVYASISPFTTYSEIHPYETEILDDDSFKHYKVTDTVLNATLPSSNLTAPRFERLEGIKPPPAVPGSYVQPLTNSATLLEEYITEFKANVDSIPKKGGTAGLSGIYNAWLTLSPAYLEKWSSRKSFFEDNNFHTSSRPSNTQLTSGGRFIIHITDGNDNKNSDGSFDPYDQYKEVCKRIRNHGVPIYIVLYGTGEKSYHRECVEGQTGPVPFLYVNIAPENLATTLDTIFQAQLSRILAPKLTR